MKQALHFTRTIKSDTRQAQAVRIADYLEQHPASTLKEIDAACDTGFVPEVLSLMPSMGYALAKGWRNGPCAGGARTRQLRTYTLLHRPVSFVNRVLAFLFKTGGQNG